MYYTLQFLNNQPAAIVTHCGCKIVVWLQKEIRKLKKLLERNSSKLLHTEWMIYFCGNLITFWMNESLFNTIELVYTLLIICLSICLWFLTCHSFRAFISVPYHTFVLLLYRTIHNTYSVIITVIFWYNWTRVHFIDILLKYLPLVFDMS